jgi:hypothetical protein
VGAARPIDRVAGVAAIPDDLLAQLQQARRILFVGR